MTHTAAGVYAPVQQAIVRRNARTLLVCTSELSMRLCPWVPLLLALLGAWAPARGAAGGDLGGATALAQQAALTRPANAAVNYVPPLADRCGHPGAASGESCGALTALIAAPPRSSWVQERRLLWQQELFVHWVKAGLTHGARLGASRAP